MQMTRFSQKLSNLELWSLLTTYRPFKGPLKSRMAEIRHLENRHDVIFSAEGGPICIKFRRLVQNDMWTAVIWSKSKPVQNSNMADIWANSMACHPRATCHIAGWSHLVKSMSLSCHIAGVIIPSAILKIVFPIFYFFCFFNAARALMSSGFRIVSDTLVINCPNMRCH